MKKIKKKKLGSYLLLSKDKNYWKQCLIQKDTTLIKLIENLNFTGVKIALVINKSGKFIGTITDGDIRKGLLRGLSLNSKIIPLVNKNPVFVNKEIKKELAIKIMRENYIDHIPLIKKDKTPFGLYFLNDLLRRSQKKKRQESRVIIMSGGKGKRLLPLTKNKPKSLIEVQGKPMLEQVILNIKKFGFYKFTLSINYLGDMIKKYFKTGKKLEVNINYIKEKKPLGTAGSLYLLKKIKNQEIIVTNCDVISEINYADVLDYHKSNSADATMVVRHYEITNPFDVVKTKGRKFLSYEEKPSKYENINTGIYVLNSKVLKHLEDEKFEDMTNFFLRISKKKLKVIVYPIYEKWADLGNKKYIKKFK
tara:strand:- start:20939 stop:22030 length:1092 start_codon:yes stop_codon:yes gene_type:complete